MLRCVGECFKILWNDLRNIVAERHNRFFGASPILALGKKRLGQFNKAVGCLIA